MWRIRGFGVTTPEDERWLLRRGLTSLAEDTQARTDASTRATPALVTIFLVVMVWVVPDLSASPTLSNVVAVLIVMVTWVGGNLWRRRRPLAAVQRIGWFERAVFVGVPAVAMLLAPQEPTLFDDETLSSAQVRLVYTASIAFSQAVLLAVVLALVTSGVVALAMWLTREVLRTMTRSTAAFSRALPLLLAVLTFAYFTAELWQSIGRLDSWAYGGVVTLFVGLIALFLTQRDHLDLDALADFDSTTAWRAALPRSAFPQGVSTVAAPPLPARCPLNWRQRANLRLVATLSRLVVAAVIGAGVFLVFLGLSALVVNVELVKSWCQADPDVLVQWATARRSYAITWEQFRVCGFLGSFATFYFAVVSATDPILRQGIADTATDTVRTACALRLHLLDRAGTLG